MKTFVKNWTLPIAMLAGALSYFLYVGIPALDGTHELAAAIVAIVQPLLLFAMLFLTFCRVKPKDMELSPWQGWALLMQTSTFSLAALLLYFMAGTHWRIVVEGTMLCLICPTATAAAVITRKLGGNAGTLTTYTIVINLAVALLIPAVVPIVHPNPD
ncbi:MAG: transporter, partial [Bacteroidaceae bacterium]|nr:transporter [Bacteroidaceae bacterium]